MTSPPERPRRAGLLVPLFSIPSTTSWGIGEIGDLRPMCAWLEHAGQRLLLMLPINEMPVTESSPYSALSAMAIDPQFITLAAVEDFAAIGGEDALEPEWRARLESVRSTPAVDYVSVRALKSMALHRAFARFIEKEWKRQSPRAAKFRAYADEQSWWLDDYALFRALHAHFGERPWTDWPQPVRDRLPDAIADARAELDDDIRYRKYVQWIAGEQWAAARRDAGSVRLFGDLPFAVSGDSADVWARQDEFNPALSVGVPPDAFSASGQDWGLPAYRWDVLAERDFDWLRQRARRNADLFDGYRVDHLVGFYRMYVRPLGGGEGVFMPAVQEEQTALGERILHVFAESGAEIIAEDLGVIPDFVRESLARLAIPGYRVFRWERHWKKENQPFRDPLEYSPVSVATSGTHDTEPLVMWWEQAPEGERQAVMDIPSMRDRLTADERARTVREATLTATVRALLLDVLCASGSDLVILPVQDVFGWQARINQPATVSDSNWTWKLPWPSDRLLSERAALEAAEFLRQSAARYGRYSLDHAGD
jgi:4-alpha-glucanotransferase